MNVNVYENVNLNPNFIHHKSRLVSATGGVESLNISNSSISLFIFFFRFYSFIDKFEILLVY